MHHRHITGQRSHLDTIAISQDACFLNEVWLYELFLSPLRISGFRDIATGKLYQLAMRQREAEVVYVLCDTVQAYDRHHRD